jgi:hypothetical protein
MEFDAVALVIILFSKILKVLSQCRHGLQSPTAIFHWLLIMPYFILHFVYWKAMFFLMILLSQYRDARYYPRGHFTQLYFSYKDLGSHYTCLFY